VAQDGNCYVLGVRRGPKTDQTKNTPDDHECERANHHDGQAATKV